MGIDKINREEIRLYLEQLFGQPVEDDLFISITVNPPYHGQNQRTINVGQVVDSLEPGSPAEEILAIFESRSFLVVTPSRGAGSGMPYIFPRHTIISIQKK